MVNGDAKAFGRADTLRAEHEVLGFYLSGHPLEDRAGLFSILSTTNTRDLQNMAGGAEITLGGLIVGLKENTTRKGKKMARFRLEDLQGGVNVTVFPRTYEENRELLIDDSVVICRAKIEERDEGTQTVVGLLLDEILDLDGALKTFKGGFVIQLDSADHERVQALSEMLENHRGKSRLFFEIQGLDGGLRRVRCNGRHSVKISAELAQDVEKLLGKGKAKLARI